LIIIKYQLSETFEGSIVYAALSDLLFDNLFLLVYLFTAIHTKHIESSLARKRYGCTLSRHFGQVASNVSVEFDTALMTC